MTFGAGAGHRAGADGAARAGRHAGRSARRADTTPATRCRRRPLHRTARRLGRPAPAARGPMSYRVHVRVMPRGGLLDPQGQAVEHALARAGLRRGRRGPRRPRHRARGGGAARAPRRRRGCVRCATSCSPIRSPRTTCWRWRRPDAQGGGGPLPRQQLRLRHAARRRAGRRRRPISSGTATPSLQGADVVILPGGFSYGDYLRSGAIARFSPIMQAVQRHAAGRRPGARHLQRLPDPVRGPPAARRPDAERGPHLRVEAGGRRRWSAPTPCSPPPTPPARRLRLPVAHGDGRFVAADDTLRMLEAEGRVVLRYVAASEASPLQPNPNGSANHIAGISQRRRHRGRHHAASRAGRRARSSASPDGLGFFTSLAAWRPRASTLNVPSR